MWNQIKSNEYFDSVDKDIEMFISALTVGVENQLTKTQPRRGTYVQQAVKTDILNSNTNWNIKKENKRLYSFTLDSYNHSIL